MISQGFNARLCIGIIFIGILVGPAIASADVVVPENLEVATVKFTDGTTMSSASGATKVWSGVVNTLSPPSSIVGIAPYQYEVTKAGVGFVTMFFTYIVSLCVVSAQSGNSSCYVSAQSGNSTTVNCTKHSDNSFVDVSYAFICLAP